MPWGEPTGVEGRRPQSILFACSENSVRSPMAEALARLHLGRGLHLASAGVRPGNQNPFVTSVMQEIDVDLSAHRPQTFEELDDTNFDLIVTLSPEAHHRALEFTRTMAVTVTYWPTFDPTAVEGSRTQMLEAFRGVREVLRHRIMSSLACAPDTPVR